MRNKVLRLVVVTILMSIGICGCLKAPERSANGDILHAKDSVEDEMAAIVNESESAMENDMQVYIRFVLSRYIFSTFPSPRMPPVLSRNWAIIPAFSMYIR